MIFRAWIVVAAAALLLIYFGGSKSHGLENVPSSDKAFVLEEIDSVLRAAWLQRWIVPDAADAAIRSNERFRTMLRQSGKLESAARAIIADPEIGIREKVMAVRLMQCLPAERYVGFVRFVVSEVQDGHCSASLLADVLYPGQGWGSGLALQYQDPDVQILLREIERISLDNERIDTTVSSIRDGLYSRYVQYLRDAGEPIVSVECSE